MSRLLEVLKGEVLVSDGSYVTALYDKGFYINRSFEELSLTEPQQVIEVIKGFQSSGAQILATNTFGATYPKLQQYGLQDRLESMLSASVDLVREVATPSDFVAATIGPLGKLLEPLGPTSFEEAEDYYYKNTKTFSEKKVDIFSLVSFHDLNELVAAIKACRKANAKIPIIAHVALVESLKTSFGSSLLDFVKKTEGWEVEVLGISGEIGPSPMLSALSQLRALTSKPISIKPNAGKPRYVNDQYIYLCNPDYLAKYSKKFISAGANIIGGHSGVGADHIRAISNSVKMMRGTDAIENETGGQKNLNASIVLKDLSDPNVSCEDPVDLVKKSALGEHLAQGQKVFTVEVLPPVGVELENFLGHCRQLEQRGVKFINIPDGARASARMSSLHLSSYIKSQFSLEPIPHLTSRDRNLLGIQSDLIGSHANGVRNLLLVTGDPPKLGNCPGATAVYDVDSIGMTHIVSQLNRGLDLGGAHFGRPSEFVIGVALNPTALDKELELKRFNYKVEAGAEYAITQPIYSEKGFESFMSSYKGKRIPIILGIWPLISLRNAEFLKYELPGVDVPDWVINEMKKANNKEEAIKRGVEIAQKVMSATESFVQGFQVSAPFGRVDIALELF